MGITSKRYFLASPSIPSRLPMASEATFLEWRFSAMISFSSTDWVSCMLFMKSRCFIAPSICLNMASSSVRSTSNLFILISCLLVDVNCNFAICFASMFFALSVDRSNLSIFVFAFSKSFSSIASRPAIISSGASGSSMPTSLMISRSFSIRLMVSV